MMAAWSPGAALLVLLTAASPGDAGTIIVQHSTDGAFTTPAEWGNVTPQAFPFDPSTGAGGSFLYVEQGTSGGIGATATGSPGSPGLGNTLFLMYDYVHGTGGGPGSFFDVFFQVPNQGTDYAVHITGGGFQAFEKPAGTVSPTTSDGSLDLSDTRVWTPLDQTDLALARFQGAIGFATSPNDPITPHLMAEFQLSINRDPSSPSPSGLYDPAPAFWSASKGSSAGDPPISSAIFTLNPDGSTTVAPALGPNGDPVGQPQQVAAAVPEPSTLASAAVAGLIGLGVAGRRRKRTMA
jgi:hypothetical protein